MPKESKYKYLPAFINRTNELDYLYNWISGKANSILFIYGPKSSGKTTLLMKFIKKYLNDKDFSIKHFNLREMLIVNYSDFIQAFFETDYSKLKKNVRQKQEYNLKMFKLSKEIIKSLENKSLDPLVVMKQELLKTTKKGKRPIIIIDELQALEDIYMNGQRELLKELFNFFVSITKESHLCHVIIASSDGYFMKKIYEDSKLTKTSEFFEVEYLNEQDTKHWLSNLEKESSITNYVLTDSQIDIIWKNLNGSMWEISKILGQLIPYAKENKINDEYLLKIIKSLITANCGKFKYYAGLNFKKYILLNTIYQLRNNINNTYEFEELDLRSLVSDKMYGIDELRDELNNLVRLNILAFNPTSSLYKLQSVSIFWGLKEYIENVPKDWAER